MQGLAQFLEQGGTLMYVNLGVSVIVLAMIIDRLIFFLLKSSVNARAFLEQIRKLVLANNVDRAVKLCSATSAPVAQVAKAGLQRVHRGEIAVAQAIEESLVDVTPMLKKRVQVLWSLANIATLVGFSVRSSALSAHSARFPPPSPKSAAACWPRVFPRRSTTPPWASASP
jgi:biopolymer transport protein ExbB